MGKKKGKNKDREDKSTTSQSSEGTSDGKQKQPSKGQNQPPGRHPGAGDGQDSPLSQERRPLQGAGDGQDPPLNQERRPLQGAGDGQDPPLSQKRGPRGQPPAQQQVPRGPPPDQQQGPRGQPPAQQQGPPQGAWGPRGPPPVQQQGPRGQPPAQQQVPRGPPPVQQQGPRGQPPAQQQGPPQGAWGPRGPPPVQQQGPRGQPPAQQQGPPQGAWGPRGPPPVQKQGPRGQPPAQQQVPRGPPPVQQQGPRGQPPAQQQGPPQGAWGPRGPPPDQQQGPRGQPPAQQQGPPQGAWGPRGPPPVQKQGPRGQPPAQQQGPPQGAWGPRGPPPAQQQSFSKQDTGQKEAGASPRNGTSTSSSKSGSSELSEGTLEFAPRIVAPKKSGKPISVFANFYRLLIRDPTIKLYHYDVVIQPDKPQFLMRLVWKTFAAAKFPQRVAAFQGRNAYSKGPLIEGTTCNANIVIVNPESNKEKEFSVTITQVRVVSWACFQNYKEKILQDKSQVIMAQDEVNVLDLILRNWASDNLITSGKHFFPLASNNPHCIELSKRLDMKLGFFQSTFLGYIPYLNFDISYRPFYHSSSLLSMLDFFRDKRSNAVNEEEFNRYIRTAKIEYSLPGNPESRRVFRVNKLLDSASRQTFDKDGTEITVAQYFATEKNYRLKYPDLPVLWVGPTNRQIYIPMELCRVLPDQVFKGLMDPMETRKMMETQSRTNAYDRYRQINDMFRKIDINNCPLMKEFGLQVSQDMEEVPARVLPAPALRTREVITVKESTWRIRNFLEPVTLRNWCVLNTDKYMRRENLIQLQNIFKSKGMTLNMQIGDPKREPMDVEPSFAALKKAFSQLKDMEMVFVIISDLKGLYSRVKTICETQEGILTQCLRSRTVSQPREKLSSTMDNILLKVNPKLGGKNHSLNANSIPNCLKDYTMVVGADVTHSSPGMKIPSAAAVAASCDPDFFQYSVTIRIQPKGEMINDLQEIMMIHLRRFYEIRKQYPKKIIFYRDGVSEGEMAKVLKLELMALKRACNSVGSDCQPKITFLVVQKRHHARFFPTRKEEEGRNANVRAGTCVDSDVVHPRDLDFYLVSHSSGLGTARPSRYRLLYDDNKLTDEEIENLTYCLCHLLSRCNRAISYPAPTYYAHLAAFRARAYLEGLNVTSDQDVSSVQRKLNDNISKLYPMFFV